jgi:hypothetical protein
MPYSIEWVVEGRVLYNRLSDPYTDDEVVTSSEGAIQRLDTASEPVFFIVNTLGLTSFPRNVVKATASVQKWLSHPHMRQLIVISNNSAVRFVSLLATQVQRNKVILHGSVDDALAYIGRQVPELAERMTPPVA